MSLGEKFLYDFDCISNRFAGNISINYALDCENSIGISYFELNRASNELSAYFRRLLGENSQYVGVSLSDYFLLPCIILGIWKSKNCFAGIGTQYSRKNNLDFLNFLGVKYVITDGDSSEYGGKQISRFLVHERQFFVWCRKIESEMSHVEGICYGIMTSGSTGEPKMVQVPWSCIVPNAVELSTEFQLTEHDCIFLASPYSFDPFFIELLMAFLAGCTLMIVSNAVKLHPSDLHKTLFHTTGNSNLDSFHVSCDTPENVNCIPLRVQKVKKKTVSILQMTPSVFRRWSDSDIKNVILSLETPLRVLILGGEKFPTGILKLKHAHNKTKIFNIYGITEISCWAFLNEVTHNKNSQNNSDISIGRPLSGIIYNVAKNGEFQIGSHQRICLVNREPPFEEGCPVYRDTGDIVQLTDGEIYCMGRTSQVVKKYGMKINMTKIEEAFMSINKLIKNCFCIYDEDSLRLGLFYLPTVVKSKEINFKLTTFEEFNSNNYKIPTNTIKPIEKPDYLIEITETPLSLHGKCDKQLLHQVLKDICKTVQPTQDVKNTFMKLWVEVLAITDMNIPSSFIELGGNSVSALDLINRLEDLGFNVPQNFISELLGGKNYESCLECLSLAQEKIEIPRKKFKFDPQIGQVGLSEVWRFDLGKCVDAPVTIFEYEGEERLVIGSHSSKLSCITRDGVEIWSTFLGDRIESGFTPTKDGSRGFIGCYDNYVYCIANSNGNVIWKFKTGDVVKSTPCLSTDEKILYLASYDKNLYCLSATDGRLEKSVKLSNGGVRCPGIISSCFNSFFIGTLDGTCAAINQASNELIWKTTVETPIFAAPCLVPNKPEILFSEVLGNVHCFNVLNGDKMWTFKAGGNIYSSPTVQVINGTHQIFFGCHDAHLYCLHYKKEPELKWKQQLDSSVFAKPLTVLDLSSVFAATTKGFIYLCDVDGGSVKTMLKLAGEVFSSAVYSKNRLFVGCRDNNVYSLEITTHEPP